MGFKLDGYEIGFPINKPKVTNCPNCGAVVTNRRCEYCGTLFNDFNNTPIGGIISMKAENSDGVLLWEIGEI